MKRLINNFILIVILLQVFFTSEVRAVNRKSEIIWDKWGVPHIFASDAGSMYYAFGWAQMASHGNMILKLYLQSRGRASEFMGKDFIESDKKILSFNIPETAIKSLSKQDPRYREMLEQFVTGMNDYIKANPDSLDKNLTSIYPVTASDVLAHTLRITCLEFLAGDDIAAVSNNLSAGSNAIAVSPVRSSAGNALLLINPHLPWYDFFTWYEAHLNCPGFEIYGVALVGMPSITMGFNKSHGWAHTVNPVDASDRFEIQLEGEGYRYGNAVYKFSRKDYKIKVREPDGKLTELSFTARYTVHGPVLGVKGDKAWAVKVAGLENARVFEQYHKMASAGSFREFETALKMLQNPLFNVIYADREGNIFYLFNGNIPKRETGDFYFWRGTVDGTNPSLLWNSYHNYNDLPRLLNPKSGFIQNCNDPPWTCTYPCVIDPTKYPAYFAPSGMSLRSQRAVNLILEHDKISFKQLKEIKHNTGMESADRFLPDLLKAASISHDPEVVEAVSILKKWDRKTEAESRGAVLFSEWWNRVDRSLFLKQWDPAQPVSTPSGIADEIKAVKLLKDAYEYTKSSYGSPDVAWGDIHRFRIEKTDIPANGGPGDQYGIFRTMNYIKDGDGKLRVIHGDTFYAIVEFGKEFRAEVIMSYGNSSQPGTRHRTDQIMMFSSRETRPALVDKKSISENIGYKETLLPKYLLSR
ncbi:MAG: acylase [Bacteroidales bacterium]